MPLRVLHDLHLGVNRSSGTTAASKIALKQEMLRQFKSLLPSFDLIILGDLFDTYEVPLSDLLDVFHTLKEWSEKGHKLYLVPGNHDLSRTSTTLSSFKFLCALLPAAMVLDKPAMTPYGYVIPHLPNQTLFDEAVAQVPECEFLFLHCNYNNFFATQSDHSLNLSKEQAQQCKANQIVIAHEHNARTEGKVTLPGCQIASSISDWVNATAKYYVTVDGPALVTEEHTIRLTEYAEIDWKELEVTGHKFVRVTGTAKVSEAALVVNTIAKFRAKSLALVISNAVQMESNEVLGGFGEALETVQGFDVWKALELTLGVEDMTTLKGLE